MTKPFTEEFFYLDEDGNQQDADLHWEILTGVVAPPAINIARAAGLTEGEIAALFEHPTEIEQ